MKEKDFFERKINRKRVLIFAPEFDAFSSGVFRSQVVGIANMLASEGASVTILCCYAKEAHGSPQLMLGLHKNVLLRSEFSKLKWGTIWSICRRVATLLSTAFRGRVFGECDVIYTRSPVAFFVIHILSNFYSYSLIRDFRGVLAEESALRKGRETITCKILRKFEGFCFKKADQLLAVSYRLSKHLKESCGDRRIAVIPSCYDPSVFYFSKLERSAFRGQLGISKDNLVICYCGGFSKWQSFGEIFSFVSRLIELDKRVVFLVISGDHLDEKQYSNPNVIHVSDPSRERMRGLLCAADFGVVFREKSLVNEVSSPIKIPEYMGCGLPVIMKGDIGDYGSLLSHEVFVKSVGEQGADREVLKDLLILKDTVAREHVESFAKARLTYSAYRKTFQEVFALRSV